MKHLITSNRLSMRDAAKLLNVHVATIWRWAIHGVRGRHLRTFMVGGRRYVSLAELEAFAGSDDPGSEAESTNREGGSVRSSTVATELTLRGV